MNNQWNWETPDADAAPIREVDPATAPPVAGGFGFGALDSLADAAAPHIVAAQWALVVTDLNRVIEEHYQRGERLARQATGLADQARALRPVLAAAGDVGQEAARLLTQMGAALVESVALTLAVIDTVDKRQHAELMLAAARDETALAAHRNRLMTLFGPANPDPVSDDTVEAARAAEAALAEALRAAPSIGGAAADAPADRQ